MGIQDLRKHQLRLVLQRFRQVHRPDLPASGQVGDRLSQLEYAVRGPRRELRLRHCRAHQALPLRLKLAVLPDLRHAHISVRNDIRGSVLRESGTLNDPDSLDTFADRFAGFADPVAAEFFVIHPGNFNMDVDPVQKQTRDEFLVFRHHHRDAGARLLRVAVPPTEAEVYTIELIFCVLSRATG